MTIHLQTAQRDRIDQYLSIAPPHMRPIMLAVRDHGAGWATIPQRIGRFDLPQGKPIITIFGDDLDVSLGPDGFHRKSVRCVLARCRVVSIVACEPLLELYLAAASAAVFGFPAAIIETRPEHEMQWLGLVKQAAPDAALLVGSVKERGH